MRRYSVRRPARIFLRGGGAAPRHEELLACADNLLAVAESNETNNCIASGSRINVTAPDLIVTAISTPPATKLRGTAFSVMDTTQNSGNGPTAVNTNTSYYLSLDQVKNAGDSRLTGLRTVGPLASAATLSGSVNVTIPGAQAVGRTTCSPARTTRTWRSTRSRRRTTARRRWD